MEMARTASMVALSGKKVGSDLYSALLEQLKEIARSITVPEIRNSILEPIGGSYADIRWG